MSHVYQCIADCQLLLIWSIFSALPHDQAFQLALGNLDVHTMNPICDFDPDSDDTETSLTSIWNRKFDPARARASQSKKGEKQCAFDFSRSSTKGKTTEVKMLTKFAKTSAQSQQKIFSGASTENLTLSPRKRKLSGKQQWTYQESFDPRQKKQDTSLLFFLESNEILSSYKTTSSTITPERKKRRFELEDSKKQIQIYLFCSILLALPVPFNQ